MSSKTLFFRWLALSSYIGLFAWTLIWHFVLSQPLKYSPMFLVLLWVVPLLLPAYGMIKGKPYTHAWVNFVIMFYLMHGLTAVYASQGETLYAAIEIVLSSTMFIGCCFYARLRGRELGLGLKKARDKQA
ncbi:DUF2069 domain-containing protein [Neptunicella marina]|uniref:DUF2069 domain-containing protein n=1 Tax=Neptunicella marina TaxID=2125989 RepID=A0A8J6M3C8_9ALTE|nr:DUF2069 domain-containing protein [Neptunicella marina]MBC3767348.1 DUF2069 domain-containing protein [Neptunicella marina]